MTYLVVLVLAIDIILIWGTINQRILERKTERFLERNNVESKVKKKKRYNNICSDMLIDMFFSLPSNKIHSAKWYVSSRDIMGYVYNLTDAQGQYLLQYKSPMDNHGWYILGHPVEINKNMCHSGIALI